MTRLVKFVLIAAAVLAVLGLVYESVVGWLDTPDDQAQAVVDEIRRLQRKNGRTWRQS